MRRLAVAIAGVVLAGACASSPAISPGLTPTDPAAATRTPGTPSTPSATPIQTPFPTPSPTPRPSPSPTRSPTGELTAAQVRYLLIDQLGPLHYCDPDEYPVSHGDEPQRAAAQLPVIQADTPTFDAITARLGITGQGEFSEADVLAIYREWKLLDAVDAQPIGSGHYQFDVTTEGDAASGRALHMLGTVDAGGAIHIASQEEVFGTSCPICLARGTVIDTPNGPVAVEFLRPGDAVWTVDAAGNRIASTVAQVGSTGVPANHQVVLIELSDGRTLTVSPGHPLIDGRRAGDLRTGDALDGAIVVSADLVAYGGRRTYDVLPAGATGFYWANGILLASTLSAPR